MRSQDIGVFVIPIRPNKSKITPYLDLLDFVCSLEACGYSHVFIGEHLTDSYEDIQSSLIFATAVLARTKSLKVALSVLPLPHYHIPLLIKQLEDIYSLSQDRLLIGFGAGALSSDLEYLGISPRSRKDLYISKLDEFIAASSTSPLLSKLPSHLYFSSLLNSKPISASALFAQGFSALSSNFTHSDHLQSQLDCLTADSPKDITSQWHVCFNFIPKLSSLSASSQETVLKTIKYIYTKLGSNAPITMLGDCFEDLINTDNFDNTLLTAQMSSIRDIERVTMLREATKTKLSGINLINLFDCIDDPCYSKQIRAIPSLLRG